MYNHVVCVRFALKHCYFFG